MWRRIRESHRSTNVRWKYYCSPHRTKPPHSRHKHFDNNRFAFQDRSAMLERPCLVLRTRLINVASPRFSLLLLWINRCVLLAHNYKLYLKIEKSYLFASPAPAASIAQKLIKARKNMVVAMFSTKCWSSCQVSWASLQTSITKQKPLKLNSFDFRVLLEPCIVTQFRIRTT